ncbi:DUF4422 domain-containing protein [Avibacterium sp. 21-586]|uniref:DUF4422 domain-containing protein n=1 Tax=Avibacterium sp. 21-586 TaxID=2911534 RepID=UPI002246EBDF|nr:DUF4422 domain-containing protein [Avibacterium sp. 21-586]MCW9710405.1 DUF4422 domain-containing protein [Avibacterium sp. 21-586]
MKPLYPRISIIIATHKRYFMPKDKLYIPLQVGKYGKEDIGYCSDDTGENISQKNPYFSELTGLYWAWKNLDYDYLGLIHYRRFFSLKYRFTIKKDNIRALYLTYEQTEELVKHYDIIVPKKRRYYIETLYSHYAHTLHQEHLDITRDIIKEYSPLYINAFDVVMKQRWGYMFNMFIMPKKLINSYCSWLFPILFELEKRLSHHNYDAFHARLYGRVSELLFNVWLYEYNQITPLKIKELPVIYGEKVNWFKKGTAFLMAKFFGKKYEKSF